MTNDWIYEKANALVKKHFTRDPFELAKDLNIHLEVMNNTTKDLRKSIKLTANPGMKMNKLRMVLLGKVSFSLTLTE